MEPLSLVAAMIGAGEAPPETRIEFRDAIARYGGAGIQAVEPWLWDPELYRFATRVIVKAAAFGAETEAKDALKRALQAGLSEDAISEIEAALLQLGVKARVSVSRSGSLASRLQPGTPTEPLVKGRVYKRRELHHAGWGGNWQSGVSYPATGDHVLLFSDPSAATEHGYRDTWAGMDTYRYFGAWSGTGDMILEGVNRTILDRSPNLLLLIRSGEGWRFEGHFSCDRYETQKTTRHGSEYLALVFVLQRVD
ncbi:MAG TPA: hypothetical protein VFO05_05425 [Candidatus Limnocylindrales bacterium]|nr:hypothetical protein [Candidatus Limnocylindrales bacterium]